MIRGFCRGIKGNMLFKDRLDAGEKLAELLSDYEGKQVAVIAIPRGGVEVGYVVASRLAAPLEVTVPRKIGSPADPELAVGAVAEDGTIYIDEEVSRMIGVREDWIRVEAERELQEVRRRIEVYRGSKSLPSLKGYTVLLVDDGIATGATMIATARFLRKLEPEKLVIAAPVAPPEIVPKISREADEMRYVDTPPPSSP